MARKKLISLDFDGVLHSYTSGWRGADQIPDAPVPGAMKFLRDLVEDGRFEVCIHSSRCSSPAGMEAIAMWLNENLWHEFGYDEGCEIANAIRIVDQKPPAHLTIDDRALTFDGTWPDLDQLAAFQPWNKRTDNQRRRADEREKAASDAEIEAAAMAMTSILDRGDFYSAHDVARTVIDAFLGKGGFNVFEGAYSEQIEDWIRDEAVARLDEYSLGRAVIEGRPVWTLSSGWVWKSLEVEIARYSYQAISDFVKGIAEELATPISGAVTLAGTERATPIATTTTLTYDDSGRPVVDGQPAMSVDEMPEQVVPVSVLRDAVLTAYANGLDSHHDYGREPAEDAETVERVDEIVDAALAGRLEWRFPVKVEDA